MKITVSYGPSGIFLLQYIVSEYDQLHNRTTVFSCLMMWIFKRRQNVMKRGFALCIFYIHCRFMWSSTLRTNTSHLLLQVLQSLPPNAFSGYTRSGHCVSASMIPEVWIWFLSSPFFNTLRNINIFPYKIKISLSFQMLPKLANFYFKSETIHKKREKNKIINLTRHSLWTFDTLKFSILTNLVSIKTVLRFDTQP